MPYRLRDWGYCVSTGPLVWNRFKTQLRSRPGKNIFPLIWAEAVTADGRFIYRAERRGHEPYFLIEEGDEWLKVSVPCVLVQRTTAKEQTRRLIAAEMPASFVAKHGAVVVENHLNMVRAEGKKAAKVNTATLATILNSAIVDQVFRCISGSVAVSAFELEALPLPAPEDMAPIENLIRRGADPMLIEAHVRTLYLPRVSGNAASPSLAARTFTGGYRLFFLQALHIGTTAPKAGSEHGLLGALCRSHRRCRNLLWPKACLSNDG